jgi:D-alanine-D-alanine ligase
MNIGKSPEEKPDARRRNHHREPTLGPVARLEEYVRPDWWRDIFNHLYLKTDGDVVDDPTITRNEIDRVAGVLGLSAGGRILDLCCGQGRHTLEFFRRGIVAEGLDRSHYLIQKARAKARAEGLKARFREGDAKNLPYPADDFDAVTILGNSFGYFETAAEDLRVLGEIRRVLKPWGRLVLDLADGEYLRDGYTPRSWEWIDKNLFVCREREISIDGSRLISREVITDVRKGVIADQFYAERLYTREAIAGLLAKAGFSDVEFFPMASASSRNQDLGMMERRFLVTATIKKAWTPRKAKKKQQTRHVVVILGDPEKPDPLKPDGIFDDDDFYTIDRMKAALRELPGYRFSYLSHHPALFQDLAKLKGKVDYVFNLCDEGFENDPTKELLVPALLELTGIPYTGAGPQSLAFCYDKSLVKGCARELGVPIPRAIFISPEDRVYEIPFDFPVLVKPNAGDSSIGITQKSIAWTIEELSTVIMSLRAQLGPDVPLIVEEFLTGKDISVGIIGNPPDAFMVLPVTEEDYSALPPGLPRICGYEAKWLPESPYWQIKSVPADIPEETEKLLVDCCLRLFSRLDCRDYCRFDWRLDAEGEPRLLEVNPNPGWCWDGHLAKMAKYSGISYAGMLGMILGAAEARIGLNREQVTEPVAGRERATAEAESDG